MKRSTVLAALASTLAMTAGVAHAAPVLRVQVDQNGDFLLVGNTLGYDCDPGTPAPVVGTISANACQQSNTNIIDSSPDVYWVSDDPAPGQALADINTMPTSARATTVLTVPAGATITHAFLYWAATNTTGTPDTQVTLERPGTGGFSMPITALQSWMGGSNNAYQSVADITSVVQQYGTGAYRVSDIDVAPFANVSKDVLFGGFWIVAFYKLDTEPFRNLALFDGMDVVKSGMNQSASLSGFLVPNAGFSGKLGVAAFEGDNQGTGDKLLFNNVALTDAQNPVDNFFNSTRSWLGAPVSVPGDLPQLTGTPQSMAGVDLDVVDITAQLTQGQSSAPIQATTSGDTYFLAGFITSISTFAQDFSTSTKDALDVNGGLLLPGDVLRYTITATNTGNDTSVKTVVTDPLPMNVTFVPGSIKIVSGPNAGPKTDAAGDDQAEYDPVKRTITARLGTGADAMNGGSIMPGASSVVQFDVTVNSGVVGDISNQGTISAGGQMGAPVTSVVTDGNGTAAGAPPTTVTVNGCAMNSDCGMGAPVCDTTAMPHVCVQCLMDSDCGGPMSGKVCDPTNDCIDGCRGMGGNGCPTGMVCSSTTNAIGTCGPAPSTSSSASSTASSSSSSASGTGGAGTGGAGTGGTSASSSGSLVGSGGAGGVGGSGGASTANGGSNVNGTGGTGGNNHGPSDSGSCKCSLEPREDGFAWTALAGLALLAAGARRRRS